ncbi:hypothetical protein OURE66S_01657 [Oligella ureolytica]
MENIVLAVFKVESEAYQAMTELRQEPIRVGSVVSQAILVSNQDERIKIEDSFDTGVETRDDTIKGTWIGALVGIIGGPLGILLGLSTGGLIGYTMDLSDLKKNLKLMNNIADKLGDNQFAIIALTQESEVDAVNSKLSKFDVEIERFDAAEVRQEIKRIEEFQESVEKETKRKASEERKEELKDKLEDIRDEIKEQFEKLKDKFD